MKKAVIVGGSNGIGLAIGNVLMNRGYFLNILDCSEPCAELLNCDQYDYREFNLLDMDEKIIERLNNDPTVEVLMVTAGIGRVASFEYLHPAEIENLLKIDLVSTIKIFRMFYERIKGEQNFYSGVMGSIAGLVSSPLFSVYAAAKAGICRFTESVNVELKAMGSMNRILNVSPGSIKGTRFNGGENNLTETKELAIEIVDSLLSKNELFIPKYEEVFKGVIKRYQDDPQKYGQESYEYKLQSGRCSNTKKVKIGYLSGTFDLFHVGHLNLLRRARENCDYLIVGIHQSGAWKGKETFIPYDERVAIVSACRYVDKVVEATPEDNDAWKLWHYDRLFVGSDYKGSDRFKRYEDYFKDKGVEIIYFPYTKTTNSSQIRKTILMKSKEL